MNDKKNIHCFAYTDKTSPIETRITENGLKLWFREAVIKGPRPVYMEKGDPSFSVNYITSKHIVNVILNYV